MKAAKLAANPVPTRHRPTDSCYPCGTCSTSMTITVKNKTALRVPPIVQRKAGIKVGDRLEFRVSGGIIDIVPKLPSAEDEYTPKQRRIIDARLDKAAEEVKKGHVSPAFETVAEFAAALKADAKKLKGKAKRSARR
jgi:hypothetical protein